MLLPQRLLLLLLLLLLLSLNVVAYTPAVLPLGAPPWGWGGGALPWGLLACRGRPVLDVTPGGTGSSKYVPYRAQERRRLDMRMTFAAAATWTVSSEATPAS